MIRLLEIFKSNQDVRFVDVQTNQETTAGELLSSYEVKTLKDRQLAFLYLDNSLQSIGVLLGFLSANYTVALLSPSLNPAYKSSLENLYIPSSIYDPTRKGIMDYLPEGRHHVLQDPGQADYSINASVNLLLTTSGTTGSPKFVKLSSDNLYENARSIADYLPILPSDVTPLNLPVNYSYGLSVLTSHMLIGGTLLCSLPNVLNPSFWKIFRSRECTSLAGTPDMYEYLKKIGFLNWDLPSLRYFTQAGGKFHPSQVGEYASFAENHGISFFVMYGQTEATARMSYLDPVLALVHPDSIGQPIPGGKFRVQEDTNELIYSGPNVFGGYATSRFDLSEYNSPEELHTGDLARVDENGLYYITGRIKRICKIHGVRINLDEIESKLHDYFPGHIFKCAEVESGVLVCSLDNNPDKSDLLNWFKEFLSVPQNSIRFLKVDSFPVLSNGKTDYQNLIRLSENIR